jgi:hypothetical protein
MLGLILGFGLLGLAIVALVVTRAVRQARSDHGGDPR